MENDYLRGTFYSEIWFISIFYFTISLFLSILCGYIINIFRYKLMIVLFKSSWHWLVKTFAYLFSVCTELLNLEKIITSLIPRPSYFLPPHAPKDPSFSVPNSPLNISILFVADFSTVYAEEINFWGFLIFCMISRMGCIFLSS